MTRRGGAGGVTGITVGGPAAPDPAGPGAARPAAGAGAGLGGAGHAAARGGVAGGGVAGGGVAGGGLGGAGQPAAAQPGGGSGGRPAGRRRRRPGDPWRAALLGVLAIAIVAGGAWALLGSSLLVVRHVQVAGSHQVTPAQVRAAAGIRLGTPLARLNAAAATAGVERMAWVRSAQVTRSWPDTVVISVRERAPALAVATAGGFDMVDIDGVVLATAARRPAGLPLLSTAVAPARLRGSPAVRAAALVMGELPGLIRPRVTSLSATAADNVTLHLRGRIIVVWGGGGDAAAKARELQSLMRTGARYYDVSSPAVAVTRG